MKTAKFSRSENQTVTFRVSLADVLERFLTPEERAEVEGWSMSAWSASEDGEDGDSKSDTVLDFMFTKSHEFKRDASGQLVEQPREPRYTCAKKSDVAKLEAKIAEVALVAEMARMQGGSE